MAVHYDQHDQLAICEKYTHVHVHAINCESANEPDNTAKWKLARHTPQHELHRVHPCPILDVRQYLDKRTAITCTPLLTIPNAIVHTRQRRSDILAVNWQYRNAFVSSLSVAWYMLIRPLCDDTAINIVYIFTH